MHSDLQIVASDLHAAQCELSEEARLTGGEWIRLLPPAHPGISELKWSTNRFMPWLVLDAVPDSAPLPRDEDGTYTHGGQLR